MNENQLNQQIPQQEPVIQKDSLSVEDIKSTDEPTYLSKRELQIKRELQRKQQKEFEEKYLVTLDTLIPSIQLEGLEYDTESCIYKSEKYDESASWDQGAGGGASTEYADYIILSLPNPDMQKFLEPLRGTILLDLGANEPLRGYAIARQSGCVGYIGVDKFNADILFIPNEKEVVHTSPDDPPLQDVPNIPYCIVKEDMLKFLKRIPADQVSVLMAGIEVGFGSNYINQVDDEITRVLNPNGAFVRLNSNFWPNLKREKCEVKGTDLYGGIDKFTKA
jgi:hypothetical protein